MVTNIKEKVGEEAEITFEFMLMSFFPLCWDNILSALSKQYTLGYAQGIKDSSIPFPTSDDDVDCFCD